MNLATLKNGEKGIITKVRGRGAFRRRIIEMGFVKGKEILVVKSAPLKDPIEYNIMGYEVSLRRSEAYLIEVITLEEAKKFVDENQFQGIINGELLKKTAKEKSKIINVALVGNPNCGKTTLFNFASSSKEHVGNYSGVTVDLKTAKFEHNGYTIKLVDLPGTYSLTAYSPEELYVRKYILGEIPDIVINVIDGSNLERNLFLTTQLIDMDVKVVAALNMYDELQKKGAKFDYFSLGKMIGVPFVPTVGSKGKGIKELFDKVIDAYEDNAPALRHIHINYGKDIENSISIIQKEINVEENYFLTDKISSRFLALKILERDKNSRFTLSRCDNYDKIISKAENEIQKLENQYSEDIETVITDAKYGFIAGALKETYKEGFVGRRKRTEIIDTFLTHKVFGFPIFLFFLWIMFQVTFSLGKFPMNWIEQIVSLTSNIIDNFMPNGALKDLLIDGIIGGVGGVIVFLPNILILFLFISIMEDTGYMSRAAFIMDKLMHKIGLHGKSFIPLIMGFGCNVPAILATRTLENRNDRLLTMLINPFMSCSARLPVYILIIGAFFPDNPGTVLFSIYAIGIFIAVLMAILFKKTIFKTFDVPFVMELPPYRIPTVKTSLRHMWNKGSQYLKKMGGVILIASILIWALGYYPRNNEITVDIDNRIEQTHSFFKGKIENTSSKNEIMKLQNLEKREIDSLEIFKKSIQQENSYIGKIGHFIEPVIQPLGFDWKMGVSLLSGVAAKEIVVSTMGVLYQSDSKTLEGKKALEHQLLVNTYKSGKNAGKKVFSPIVAFAFLMFILIYFPCVAVIAAIKKESGSWKWALFMIFYTTTLAWIVSFLVYQIGSLF